MESSSEVITRIWWFSLSTIGIINVTIALRIFLFSKSKYQPITKNEKAVQICGLIYSICCAFRSILPRLDVERVCMYDTWLSYIAIGRTVAFIAEVSFAYQLSSILSELSLGLIKEYEKYQCIKDTEKGLFFIHKVISQIQFWMLVIANLFCWTSVITTNQIFHAIEESLWMLSALLLFISYSFIRFKANNLQQNYPKFQIPNDILNLFYVILFLTPIYILFMIFFDIPMYYHRWLLDESIDRKYLDFISGVFDSFQCREVTKSFDFWKNEMPWMSGYFSVAVWISIWLMRSPSFFSTSLVSDRKKK